MKKMFAAVLAVTVWSALAIQLVVSINMGLSRGFGWLFGVSMYVAFFTVTTNFLVALAVTVPLIAPRSAAARFFASAQAITGVAASIVMVCVIYNTLLAHIWNPRGLGRLADLLLHDVVPTLFVAYWWIVVPKRSIPWRAAALWGIYPIVYFVYAMTRGLITGFYPYPFINLASIGPAAVILNALGVLLAYFVILSALVALKSSFRAEAVPETAA
ncbi:MAG: Pr6Pr family membrane protein [Rudaea sp.]